MQTVNYENNQRKEKLEKTNLSTIQELTSTVSRIK